MANFKDSATFQKHDDYYTPSSAWKQVNHLIPKDKIIWEMCMLNSELSKSPEYLEELGNKVVYDKKMDCLVQTPVNYDMVVTNIPFSTKIKKEILIRLVELDKPFIIIINSLNTYSKYMRVIFKNNLKHLQIITPHKKINFDKLVNNELVKTKKCSFYCVYLCYKMNFETKDLWL